MNHLVSNVQDGGRKQEV